MGSFSTYVPSNGHELRKTEEILVIVEGHDSGKEGISLNDKLVKDADKLWRYSGEGVEINSRRYAFTFGQYLERLRTNLAGWFLTDSARQIAKTEMADRLRESEKKEKE